MGLLKPMLGQPHCHELQVMFEMRFDNTLT